MLGLTCAIESVIVAPDRRDAVVNEKFDKIVSGPVGDEKRDGLMFNES